ncbi:hypothetical protein LTR84_012480 [Exophiala bonariae]|uniref:Xylanolytic transcriptional activator regulatory domain-containing protein n=1 Tax=Exophiala bonariae TaxID=1690606 RepID=A0AAV9NE56_9EURO|nr:hypothetical protein LTR84_012480 [Exophiala bonariae]
MSDPALSDTENSSLRVPAGSEREIENVNERLASLEKILKLFVGNNKTAALHASPPTVADSLSTPTDSQTAEPDVGYEGDSSFNAHSKLAVMSFESGLNNYPYSSSIQDVSAAVATLRGFLTKSLSDQNDSPASGPQVLQEIIHYPQLSSLQLPPMDIVLRLLRHIKVHGHRFLYECPMLNLQEINALCQDLFFPAEPCTIATFITTHTALYYLFRDLPLKDMEVLNLNSSEVKSLVEMCVKNAQVAFRNLRLVMDPTYENLQALMIGAISAMDLSRPAFGWSLISAACRLCQDAGYHRLPSYSVAPDADTTKKRLLFWFIYTTDRNMALNFGRAPNLQSYDISVERPKIPEEMPSAWGTMYYMWMDYADIQGDIYEQLYSARAQSEPIEDKVRHARRLAKRMHELRKEFGFVDISRVPYGEEFQQALLSTEITILSALTLIYRAIPPPASSTGEAQHPLKPNAEALSTARQALTTSLTAWETLRDRPGEEWRSFILWGLLWCPFIPFLVVFGNSIVERNRQDLELLENIVIALQAAQPRSDMVDKLEKACKIFSQISRIYLDQTEGSAQQQQHHQKNSRHFDSALVPSVGAGTMSTMSATNTSNVTMQQPEVQITDTVLSDFPLSQQNWDSMFNEWDLGLGAENAREISSYFEQLTGAGPIPNMFGMPNPEPFG